MQRGNVVECVEKPGYISELTRGKDYVVNDVSFTHGYTYIKIIGDDDRPHSFLSTMFRVKQ